MNEVTRTLSAIETGEEHAAQRLLPLVKLRYFAGRSAQEAAHLLGISRATADRDWSYARAFLYFERDGVAYRCLETHHRPSGFVQRPSSAADGSAWHAVKSGTPPTTGRT